MQISLYECYETIWLYAALLNMTFIFVYAFTEAEIHCKTAKHTRQTSQPQAFFDDISNQRQRIGSSLKHLESQSNLSRCVVHNG